MKLRKIAVFNGVLDAPKVFAKENQGKIYDLNFYSCNSKYANKMLNTNQLKEVTSEKKMLKDKYK